MDTQSGPVAINARIDNDGILNFDLRGLDPELWYLNR
jgi:hypothetical protein